MMIRIIFCFFAIIFLSSQVFARPVVADLSLRKIEIDSGFTGTDILLFGARIDAGDVVVVVKGPNLSYIVRKKEKIGGIWVNRKYNEFKDANGFYAVASSRPLSEVRNDNLLENLEIGIDNINFFSKKGNTASISEFEEALVSQLKEDNLYLPNIEKVSFTGDTLFRTLIHFPENIPRGTYIAEIYLFSGGQLIAMQTTPLLVKKKGIDALIYDFGHKYPAVYGIFAVIMALFAGWIAGQVFRKV